MPRRRQQSLFDDAFDLLKVTPVWVGPALALGLFLLLRLVLFVCFPAKQSGLDAGTLLRPFVEMSSWFFPAGILMAWTAAEIWKLVNRHLLDAQTGLASIRDLSWREFERLVSEGYRRKGYLAEVVGSECGDGGIDILLIGHGETVLVQCKQWKAYRVGVPTVRELLGVVVSEKADRGIVVTSGRFTQEAIGFARQNRQIELVDGVGLVELIRGVQVGAAPASPPAPASAPAAPACPVCGSPMVLRTARKGQNAGSQFWGCSAYSTSGCRGTRQVTACVSASSNRE